MGLFLLCCVGQFVCPVQLQLVSLIGAEVGAAFVVSYCALFFQCSV